MSNERTYHAKISQDQLEELLQYGTTKLKMGGSTYVDVRLQLGDGDDMKEYAELLGDMTVSMAYEAAIANERDE